MRRLTSIVLGILALAFLIGFRSFPTAYAWSSSPVITANGATLTIQFDFSQMSNPPTSAHHPFEYQVRASTDGGTTWSEFTPVSLSPFPTTTVFTVTYQLPEQYVQSIVQARLDCTFHGWSDWGPSPPTPVPEFAVTPFVLIPALITSLYLIRRRL